MTSDYFLTILDPWALPHLLTFNIPFLKNYQIFQPKLKSGIIYGSFEGILFRPNIMYTLLFCNLFTYLSFHCLDEIDETEGHQISDKQTDNMESEI